MMTTVPFSDLLGKTLTKIERDGNDELLFICDSGERYRMYYEPDCCATCDIEDIAGELDDLVGAPILMAEEATSVGENPEGVPVKEYQDSFTWTFYKLATIKGYVTIRWYGESNGYYSESVDFVKLEDADV